MTTYHANCISATEPLNFKHGNRWQLVLGARPAGMAIRALPLLGLKQAPSALTMLYTKLPPVQWAAMRSARAGHPAVLPSWMARAVNEISEHP